MTKIECCSCIFGFSLICSGIFALAVFPDIFSKELRNQLTIKEGTPAYDAWKNASIPTKISFYLFSVENPGDVVNGAKPLLKQKGPYTYIETLERISTVFHDNGTVTYEQRKFWYFLENESSDLDEAITVVDVPVLGTATSLSSWMSWVYKGRPLFISKTARELLFDGYSDPLLTMGQYFVKGDIPMDQFGWFYKRNGTTWSDNFIEMDTGTGTFSELGNIRTWKYKNRTNYPDKCGEVRGSAAGHIAPSNKEFFDYFSIDICRPIRFEKPEGCHNTINGRSNQETETECRRNIAGINGVFYELNPRFTFGNVSTNPENYCYHPNMPYGVHNGTGCKGDLPTFISLPHFYGADPYFSSLLAEGSLSPDKSKHSTSVTVHNLTAVPLHISMRLQISLQLQRNEAKGEQFHKLPPTVFLPVLWFDAQVAITQEMADELKMLDNIPVYAFWTGVGLLVCGLLVLLLMLWLRMTGTCAGPKHKQIPAVPVDLVDFAENSKNLKQVKNESEYHISAPSAPPSSR